jgi:hypothetical protein
MRLHCPSHSTHVANPNFGTRYRYLNRIQIPLCTTLLLGSHFETLRVSNLLYPILPILRRVRVSNILHPIFSYTSIRLYSRGLIMRHVHVSNIYSGSHFWDTCVSQIFTFHYNTHPGVTFRLDNRIYQSRWIANIHLSSPLRTPLTLLFSH